MLHRDASKLDGYRHDWLSARAWPRIVLDGFPAYVRILHPALGTNGARLRWVEVAANSGRSVRDFSRLEIVPLQRELCARTAEATARR